jgi:hypothetical protein
MKSLFMGLGMSALLFASASYGATDRPTEKDMVVNVHDVFIPAGFDENSDVYVVASGVFPNSCYRWKSANVEHNKATNTHKVAVSATVSQGMCLMVLVPWQREIGLGQLGRGEHKLQFVNGDGTYLEKTLVIE